MKYVSKIDALKLSHQEATSLISGRIKQARLNSGLSQADVAQELHISQSTYSRMESAKSAPDCAQIRTLSGLYGLSVLWLLGYPSFVVHATQNDDDA
jgi:transcriptional regulator with XRE-family HTH domain